MSTCLATKRNGEPCTLPGNGPTGLCWAHDPKNQERRRRGQSRGGKSKPTREIVAIRGRLSTLADDVLEGRVDRADAAVVGQLLGTVIRAIATELKVKEVLEFEERLRALERAAEAKAGGRQWGG